MELDETVELGGHPLRRVLVAIRERLREILEDLESREIVARVITPIPWISSMVIMLKPNGTLHIVWTLSISIELCNERTILYHPSKRLRRGSMVLKYLLCLMLPMGSGTLFLMRIHRS